MSKHSPGLEMRNVRLTLGATKFHFDCSVRTGIITAITGPSGSGKSTFLNLIAGFEQPDTGQVIINGHDLSNAHPAERPISLVFQDNNLFTHLDLFTNVGLGIDPALKLTAQDRRAVSDALDWVGLSGMEKRKPATLSGGERQRVAFARALVRKKPLLLLDEPFGALDPALRGDMGTLLLNLHRETANTVLLVSHNPDDISRLAQDMIHIENGKVVQRH
ncbi:ATP-binding cassette domain-containing protein [Rhizobium sp. FKY42]|uniref:thiamine ABC transporter ATP-binding protein n=1 Tax=Rhizobium sp. FKY42 TaxID=2562310 RepID=UPI0010C0146C|nr:ATP-binding cassette domain-containing protein [Rhizobium sp. FKY42]